MDDFDLIYCFCDCTDSHGDLRVVEESTSAEDATSSDDYCSNREKDA